MKVKIAKCLSRPLVYLRRKKNGMNHAVTLTLIVLTKIKSWEITNTYSYLL